MARLDLRRIVAAVVAVAVIGGAGAALSAFIGERRHNPYTDDASIDADGVHLASSVSGQIIKLSVHENQFVKAGDVLFEIDPEPF